MDVSKMFWQQITGYQCPDMRGLKAKIQNESPSNVNGDSSDFYFVLDTCDHLKGITNKTDADCEPETESQKVLE